MSTIKEYAFELDQERCLAWIKKHHGVDVDPDEDSELWENLSADYAAMIDAEAEEAEYRWLERHTHNEFFNEFTSELTTAAALLNLDQDDPKAITVYKLVYAHTVTLLEALVSSVVRSMVVTHEELMINVATKYEELSKKKYTVKEIAEQPKGIESIVLKTLTSLSFHNVATLTSVLEAMFGRHMAGLDLAQIAAICSKRHDIVHRNGRSIDDELLKIDAAEVAATIEIIREFAIDLKRRIYHAVEELEDSPF